MVLPNTIDDREYQKFEGTPDGPAVRTTATISLASGLAQETTLQEIEINTAYLGTGGSTFQGAATVGTSPLALPAVIGNPITSALIRCPSDTTPGTKRLLYSFDGGTVYAVLTPGEFVGWSPKGDQTQIYIKGNVAAVPYEVIINRAP